MVLAGSAKGANYTAASISLPRQTTGPGCPENVSAGQSIPCSSSAEVFSRVSRNRSAQIEHSRSGLEQWPPLEENLPFQRIKEGSLADSSTSRVEKENFFNMDTCCGLLEWMNKRPGFPLFFLLILTPMRCGPRPFPSRLTPVFFCEMSIHTWAVHPAVNEKTCTHGFCMNAIDRTDH